MRARKIATFTLTVLLLSFVAPPAHAEELWLNMVAATSTEGAPPMALFAKAPINVGGAAYKPGVWQAVSGTAYSKLHMYFDRDFEFGGIKIDSCANVDRERFEMYLNFTNRFHLTFNGRTANYDFDSIVDRWFENEVEGQEFGEDESGQLKREFTAGIRKAIQKIRSITLNFLTIQSSCLSSIEILDKNKKPYAIRIPRLVEGTAKATSTAEPADAYNVMNLFDSRYESAWVADGKSTSDTLEFTFAQPQTITMLKIWNGYQRSETHCYENARPKSLEVTGDGGYKATLALDDAMGNQDLKLPRPFTGKNLKLTVRGHYKGKSNPDLMVVTELRFFDGKEWFSLDPTSRIKEIATRNREAFKKSNLDWMLRKQIKGEIESEGDTKIECRDDDNELRPCNAKLRYLALFRFREEGSFYFEGGSGKQVSMSDWEYRRITALGNYEVLAVGQDSIDVRVFGLYNRTNEEKYEGGDCNGFGRDCNKKSFIGRDTSTEKTAESLFREFLRFKLSMLKNNEGRSIDAVTVENIAKFEFLIMKHFKHKNGKLMQLNTFTY